MWVRRVEPVLGNKANGPLGLADSGKTTAPNISCCFVSSQAVVRNCIAKSDSGNCLQVGNYSQQFTVDRLFRELALRRAAHDCITGDGSSGAALRLC